MSYKLEIESRPTQEDFDEKVQHCNRLRLEVENLSEQMVCNEKLLEEMQSELKNARDREIEVLDKVVLDHSMQTDEIDSTKEVSVAQEAQSSAVLTDSPPTVDTREPQKPSAKTPPSSSVEERLEDEVDHDDDDDNDDALNNHPKVLYEEELIVFKEKCTNLTAENIRLHHEIGELRNNMSHFHNNWLHNFLLKYLVPVLIVFVAYIFFLLK